MLCLRARKSERERERESERSAATMLGVGVDVDDNRVLPENAEIEVRLRFERDLIEGERLENPELDGASYGLG
jgi:hypothetical protein